MTLKEHKGYTENLVKDDSFFLVHNFHQRENRGEKKEKSPSTRVRSHVNASPTPPI